MKTNPANIWLKYLLVLSLPVLLASCLSRRSQSVPPAPDAGQAAPAGTFGGWSYKDDYENNTTTLSSTPEVVSITPKWTVSGAKLEFIKKENITIGFSYEDIHPPRRFSFLKSLKISLKIKDVIVDFGTSELCYYTTHPLNTFHQIALKDAHSVNKFMDIIRGDPSIEVHFYAETSTFRWFMPRLHESHDVVIKFDATGLGDMMREMREKRDAYEAEKELKRKRERIAEEHILEAVAKMTKPGDEEIALSLVSKSSAPYAGSSVPVLGAREQLASHFTYPIEGANLQLGYSGGNLLIMVSYKYLSSRYNYDGFEWPNEFFLQIKNLKFSLWKKLKKEDKDSAFKRHGEDFYVGKIIEDDKVVEALIKALMENPKFEICIYNKLPEYRRARRDERRFGQTMLTGNFVDEWSVFEFQTAGVKGVLRGMEEKHAAYRAAKGKGQNAGKEPAKSITEKAKFDYADAGLAFSQTLEEENAKEDFAIMKDLAESGNVNAMFIIANAYFHGIGTPPDKFEAAVWAEVAANHGSLDAFILWTRLRHDDYVDAVVNIKVEKIMKELDEKFSKKKN
jgi:hypothetical protein